MRLQEKNVKNGMRMLAIYYIIWLIFILVFKMSFSINDLLIERKINLIPFYHDNNVDIKVILDEMVLNILVFLPLGIMIRSIFFDKKSSKSIFFMLTFSLIVESLQYVLSIGIFDITDIINNTLGGILGITLYSIFVKKSKSKFKVDRFIFLITFIGAIFISLILIILLKYNGM